MSHRIIILAEVEDTADYSVIQDNLSDFPEIIDVSFPASLPEPGKISINLPKEFPRTIKIEILE